MLNGNLDLAENLQRKCPKQCLCPSIYFFHYRAGESLNHFFWCPYASSCWIRLLRIFSFQWVLSKTLKANVLQLLLVLNLFQGRICFGLMLLKLSIRNFGWTKSNISAFFCLNFIVLIQHFSKLVMGVRYQRSLVVFRFKISLEVGMLSFPLFNKCYLSWVSFTLLVLSGLLFFYLVYFKH